jgi:hypothetical protein
VFLDETSGQYGIFDTDGSVTKQPGEASSTGCRR